MIRRTFFFSLLLLVPTCGSDNTAPPADAAADMAQGADAPDNDAADASTPDASAPDASTDASTPDASTDASAPDASTDASTPTDAAGDGSAPTDVADAGCGNTVTLGPTNVPETAGAGEFPTPAGGTIADGTYHLTGFFIYPPGSVDPYNRRETLVFSGSSVHGVRQDYTGVITRTDGTFTASGSNITFTVTCPTSGSITVPYTASGNTLRIFDTSPGNREVHEYTRQ